MTRRLRRPNFKFGRWNTPRPLRRKAKRQRPRYRASALPPRMSVQGLALKALLECQADGPQGARLTLNLSNAGPQAVTGTLFFPTLTRLSLGDPSETWCFCGRRGGVISREACEMRDPIGEAHALQVDGFFNPSLGAGVCLMPRDLQGVFRWYRVGKDAQGGNYALEFLPQTVAADESWQCVPTVVAVVPGDWRDQFQAYLSWVKTWYSARRAAQGLVSERVFLSGERPWPPRPAVHADRPATGSGGEGKPAEGPDPRQHGLPAPVSPGRRRPSSDIGEPTTIMNPWAARSAFARRSRNAGRRGCRWACISTAMSWPTIPTSRPKPTSKNGPSKGLESRPRTKPTRPGRCVRM